MYKSLPIIDILQVHVVLCILSNARLFYLLKEKGIIRCVLWGDQIRQGLSNSIKPEGLYDRFDHASRPDRFLSHSFYLKNEPLHVLLIVK